VSKALANVISYKPCKLVLENIAFPAGAGEGGVGGGGGRGGGGGGGSSPSAPKGASNLSIITSTGGLQGLNSLLLVSVFINNLQRYAFATFDPTNFNCEEDCVYKFKMEDIKLGRNVDVHKVYLQLRDLGKVTFNVQVAATLLDRKTNKETISTKNKDVVFGTGDGLIHSRFIDLKIQGERPQLIVTRKAKKGPLGIITAMFVGNMVEEEQL
jgi:hypothetical protein